MRSSRVPNNANSQLGESSKSSLTRRRLLKAGVAGGGFDWNADALTANGNPRVERLIKPPHRDGWQV